VHVHQEKFTGKIFKLTAKNFSIIRYGGCGQGCEFAV